MLILSLLYGYKGIENLNKKQQTMVYIIAIFNL